MITSAPVHTTCMVFLLEPIAPKVSKDIWCNFRRQHFDFLKRKISAQFLISKTKLSDYGKLAKKSKYFGSGANYFQSYKDDSAGTVIALVTYLSMYARLSINISWRRNEGVLQNIGLSEKSVIGTHSVVYVYAIGWAMTDEIFDFKNSRILQ